MEELKTFATEWIRSKPESITPIICASLLVGILYKSVTFIWQRLEMRRTVERAGIPQAEGGNLIFGLSKDKWVRKNFCKLLLNSHKKLGKYVAVFFGPDTWVFTTDLDLIKKVFVLDGGRHVNQYDLRIKVVPPVCEGIFQLKDDRWRQARRSVNPLFTNKQVGSRLEVEERHESCKKLLAYIAATPINSTGGRRLDVLHDFTAFMLDVSLKKILDRHDCVELEPGHKSALVDKAEISFKTFYNSLVVMDFLFKLSPLVYLHRFTVLGSYFQLLDEIIGDSIRMKTRSLTARRQETSTIGAPLSKVIDTFVGPGLRIKDLNSTHNQLSFFLLAFFETTSKVLTILFWYLAKHPAVQEKLREAIISDGEEAAYLEWCIKETIRLYPPVTMFGGILTEDVTTATGVTIKKGMTLTVCPYAVHRIEEYWGPDANEFRPDRFAQPLAHRSQFIGFGAGNRGCPGQHLAWKTLKEITVQLLTQYKVEPTDTTPDAITWSPRNFVSLLVRGPIELNFIEFSTASI